MRINGRVDYQDGSKVYNLQIPVENSFPTGTDQEAEFWGLLPTNTEGRPAGIYYYDTSEGDWVLLITELTAFQMFGDTGSGTFPFNTLDSTDSVKVTNPSTNKAALVVYNPRFQGLRTSDFILNTSANTSIPWQTSQTDSSGSSVFSHTAGSADITVLKSGTLAISFGLNLSVRSSANREMEGWIEINGSPVDKTRCHSFSTDSNVLTSLQLPRVFVDVNANDVLNVVVDRSNNSTSTFHWEQMSVNLEFLES